MKLLKISPLEPKRKSETYKRKINREENKENKVTKNK